ncbi:MAG: CBS domain-containing protein [Bacillus subtilis]|nr:CBS domain-containing protein [Bacillus subtilis]
MDILAFMKPTREVVTVRVESSLSEALATMEKYRFTSIPIIDARGRYAGTAERGRSALGDQEPARLRHGEGIRLASSEKSSGTATTIRSRRRRRSTSSSTRPPTRTSCRSSTRPASCSASSPARPCSTISSNTSSSCCKKKSPVGSSADGRFS